jgi:hypothetical protein
MGGAVRFDEDRTQEDAIMEHGDCGGRGEQAARRGVRSLVGGKGILGAGAMFCRSRAIRLPQMQGRTGVDVAAILE